MEKWDSNRRMEKMRINQKNKNKTRKADSKKRKKQTNKNKKGKNERERERKQTLRFSSLEPLSKYTCIRLS